MLSASFISAMGLGMIALFSIPFQVSSKDFRHALNSVPQVRVIIIKHSYFSESKTAQNYSRVQLASVKREPRIVGLGQTKIPLTTEVLVSTEE